MMVCVYCAELIHHTQTHVGAGDGSGQRFAHRPCYLLVQLGQASEVNITGLPAEVSDIDGAVNAIRADLTFGHTAHHNLENLKHALREFSNKAFSNEYSTLRS